MNHIHPAPIRDTVQVRFPNGRAYDGPKGTTIEEFLQYTTEEDIRKHHVVAAFCDGNLRELSQPLMADARLVPVDIGDPDGARIYRRSISFLMVAAASEVLPGQTITIQHSMPFGGYYCERPNNAKLTDEELNSLRTRMRELVEQDHPLNKITIPLDEALQIFRDNGDTEKAELFARRRKDYLTLYELREFRDYFHGFMVPSTGYLDTFELHHYNDGFILQFPRRHAPGILQPFEDEPRLAKVFQDYNDWLSIIGVPSVASLNYALNNGRCQEVILVAEAFHQRQLSQIAYEIADRRREVKLVMISGPSSSGKTTFSKRLAVQLLAQGIHPVTIAMDNYFVNRDDTPRDENGEYDFEALEAVDVAFLRKQLGQLLSGETIVQPTFNFLTGKREWGSELSIGPDHVILIEGIHGLNPKLVEGVPSSAMYRIFISALTQLNLDRHNRVPTTDTRLLRRIVRDAAHRGYTATDTISRWPSVRRGERFHIFPHQNNADVFFNSALVYEQSVLKALAQPLLLQVEPGHPARVEANRLLAFLQWFDPIPSDALDYVASDSILREFIGGSILDKFEIWRP
ncbi:MAG: nucleoside kinase [Anaerolineae bacterium]|nr:nucleoside kinase [Anaerolineae bacterium]